MQAQLLGFTRFLAGRGLRAGTAEVLDALRAAELVGPESGPNLRAALRAALTHRRDDFARFADLFEQYFRQGGPEESGPPSAEDQAPPLGLMAAGREQAPMPPDAASPASDLEILGRRGFSGLDPAQAGQVLEEVRLLLEPLARRLSRRRAPGGRRELNWRSTMRRSLASGGELADLRFRRRRSKQRRLVVLADVSGSMELSTPYLFHFLRGLSGAWRRVEAFVFATRLTRVTEWLARPVGEDAMARLRRMAPDLAGGTRLGAALSALQGGWGRFLGPATVVLIASDGWDRGDPALTARQMARLRRTVHRVVWLNPLLESPRFLPQSRGMRAALPYVDHLLACHNLDSLKRVATMLDRLVR